MKKFGRTNDMVTLCEFFPELCDIRDLYLVQDAADYRANAETLSKLGRKRPDTLIGEKVIKGIHKGTADENEEIMNYIKNENPNGAMIMYSTKSDSRKKRFQGDGGMSIAVKNGKSVIIECVGPGFDGGDLTHGQAAHESYFIDWSDISRFSVGGRRNFRVHLVDPENYKKQEKKRKSDLVKYGFDPKEFEGKIPETYNQMPDQVFQFIMPSIKKLPKIEGLLAAGHLDSFSINGEVSDGKFAAIQMPTEERHKKAALGIGRTQTRTKE
jgi:hypothetical protein